MANVYKALYQAILSATTVTTTYTVPASTSATIATITVVNVSSTTSATIKVWQVPTSATSPLDDHVIQNTLALGPGEKMVLRGPKTVGTGVTFKVQASVANTLNCLIEGMEMS